MIRSDARDEANLRPNPSEGSAFPTRGVDRAVAVHVQVGDPRHPDEWLLGRRKRRAFGGQTMMIDPIPAPIGGERRVVPRGREAWFIDPSRTAPGAASVIS